MIDIEDFFIKLPFSKEKIKENMFYFMNHYDMDETAQHSLEVAKESKRLASKFNLCPQKAYIAGLLHDIGGVVPNDERIRLAIKLNMTIFDADKELPLLLHQNFSSYISKELFNINDEEVLSSMACHTTLKMNATDFDKLIFISDKLKWDRNDRAPYLDSVLEQIEVSLDNACLTYFDWAFDTGMTVIHPSTQQAYDELKYKSGKFSHDIH